MNTEQFLSVINFIEENDCKHLYVQRKRQT